MVRRHLSYGHRDEGVGRIRITRRGRIAGLRYDKRLAEKALHAKTKFKLTHRRRPSLRCGPCNTCACWRLRAAIEALPHEHLRLGAVAVGYLSGDDFAARLDRCIERASKAPKLIELKSDP